MNTLTQAFFDAATELCEKHDWIVRDYSKNGLDVAPPRTAHDIRIFVRVLRKHVKPLLPNKELSTRSVQP